MAPRRTRPGPQQAPAAEIASGQPLPAKDRAAVALGRRGGRSTSPAKQAASRENGKKGGWPKGRPRKPAVG